MPFWNKEIKARIAKLEVFHLLLVCSIDNILSSMLPKQEQTAEGKCVWISSSMPIWIMTTAQVYEYQYIFGSLTHPCLALPNMDLF